jgi:RNA polymerase sigma factor for flagellar operon FliA
MRFSDVEMTDVWVEYKKTGSKELRNRLIEKYMPLVRYIAERLLATLPSYVDADDLTSMGRLRPHGRRSTASTSPAA